MVRFTRAVLIFATSTVGLVSAANICASTVRGCSLANPYACCSNISSDRCCVFPSNYGWSTRFTEMPSGSWGYTYGDTCGTQTGGASATNGETCMSVFDAPSYLNTKSGKWKISGSARRSEDEAGRDTSDCVEVDTFGFSGKDGEKHEIRIPHGRAFGELEALAQQGRFDELLKLAGKS